MITRTRSLAALMLMFVAIMAAGGCVRYQSAVLYADTLTREETGFNMRSPQYAYHGEPVTFDFAPDYAATHYTIIIWPDGSPEMLGQKDVVNTYFRVTRSFEGAVKPREYKVIARGYQRVGSADWYFDTRTEQWTFQPMSRDMSDRLTGEADMTIRCYIINLDLPIRPGNRTLRKVELSLIRDDMQRTTVGIDSPGVRLIGPDPSGEYRLQYTPKYNEINRTGQTDIELLVRYTDGTEQLQTTSIDTP